MSTKFDRDDICKECLQPRDQHGRVPMVSGGGVEFLLYHCPDLSLPNPDRDDDPWEADQGEGLIGAMFDPYD